MLQSKAIRLLLAFIFPFFLTCSLFSQEKNERLQGLLWEITGNDSAKKGYLYGTMHVPRKLAFNLSDTFFLVLQYADVIALETDHDVWQEFSKNMEDFERSMGYGSYGGSGGFYDPSLRLGDLYKDYFDFSAPEKERFGMLLASKPSMTNQLMYRSNSYAQEYEEDTYLDQFIFQAGKKLGKEVGGLETLEGSYGAAMRSGIPDDDAKEQPYRRGGVAPGAIEEAYRDQDLTKLDSLNKLGNTSKNFQKYMLDVRNVVHADGIDSVLQLGKAIFAGVGAAHLPGETGVIKLLRDKGYTVRPVVFTNTDVAFSIKKEIEEMRYPVQMSRQWSEDSVWTADAPGPFYKSLERGELEQHLSADMANGAYYAVYRLNTFGLWNGQTPDYIAGRIDSLIYEYTPGKIQERVQFEAPVPGHTITTRTRRGDVHRYQFYVMPNEVLLFSTGGIGDYALGKEADAFLESIEVRTTVGQKGTYQPKGKGYQVNFPADLIVNTPAKESADIHYVSAWDRADSAVYFLYRVHYPDFGYIEEDTFELNIICESIAKQFTDSLPEMHLVRESPYPTQDFSYKSEKDGAYHFGRIVIDGSAYYFLGSRRRQDERPAGFFDSFKIKKETYPQGFYTKTDTALLFETKTLKEIKVEEQPFFGEFKAIVEEIQAKNRKLYADSYDDEDDAHTGSVMLYDAQSSGQAIRVVRENMKDFSFIPTVDSFQNFVEGIVDNGEAMALQKSYWKQLGDNHIEAEYIARDTNSNRMILNKIIAYNTGLYRLVTVLNADKNRPDFVQNVFKTFRSTDTVYQALPFGRRDLSYLEKMYAVDSLTRTKAIVELKRHGRKFYEKEDFPRIRTAMEQVGFDTLKLEIKEELLNAVAGTETRSAVNYLKAFFVQNPDSAMLRKAAIRSMTRIESKYAFEQFFDLLEKEPVYLGEYFDIGNLDDTLELAAQFTDELVDMAMINSYNTGALTILHALQEQGLIKAKKYKKLKEHIRQEVAIGLAARQYNAERNRLNKNGYYDYDPFLSSVQERNLELLRPFLKKDKKVKATFDTALRHGDAPTRLAIYGLYLQENIPIQEEKLQAITEDEQNHFVAYKTLAKAGVLNRYADWFRDTMSLVESMILTVEEDVDSLMFISKHKAVYQNKPATLYFFDVKEKNALDWGLAVVTVPKDLAAEYQEKDGRTGSSYRRYGNNLVEVSLSLSGTKKEAYIKNKIAEIRFVNRARYQGSSAYDYDDYNY